MACTTSLPSRLRSLSVLVLLGGLLAASCRGTQRVPGPLWIDEVPGAQGSSQSAQAALPVGSVIRHSSPVWVRRPGASAGTQVAYYNKRVRVQSGAEVRVGFGGRAELLWPDRSSSVVLFNSGTASFGEPSLDEALLTMETLGRAQVTLDVGDRIRFPGGADLMGDGATRTGPILVDALSGELMRFKNQSKQVCRVRFRGTEFELLGGETLDLPLLLVAERRAANPLLEPVLVGQHVLLLSAGLQADFDGRQVRVRADAPGDLSLGEFRVHLEAGEQAVFSGLDNVDQAPGINSSLPAQE